MVYICVYTEVYMECLRKTFSTVVTMERGNCVLSDVFLQKENKANECKMLPSDNAKWVFKCSLYFTALCFVLKKRSISAWYIIVGAKLVFLP